MTRGHASRRQVQTITGRRRGAGVIAATVALMLMGPVVAPAVAAGFDAVERQAMSLEEAREYTDALGFDAQDVDMVDAVSTGPNDTRGEPDDLAPMSPATPEAVQVPEAGIATLTLPDKADADPRSAEDAGRVTGRAGELGVGLRPTDGASDRATGPVKISHLGQHKAEQLGAVGPVLTLQLGDIANRAVGGMLQSPAAQADVVEASGGRAVVDVDVSYLAGAGGGLVHRLRLVELPECVLTSPAVTACQQQTPVSGITLDTKTMRISGVVDVPDPATAIRSATDSASFGSADAAERAAASASEMTVLAVTAGTAGSTGDWGATSLAPSSSWNVSAQTGAFSWSYPMRTPPVPGGLAPDLSLSYSSASHDGRVVSSNSQSSHVGDGWEANMSGYVERKYVPCSEDRSAVGGQTPNNASRATGDLCWKSDNATLVFNGSSTELVRDGATSTWRPERDDNTVVSHVTGKTNGDNNGESWEVTTDDGTKYFFGQGARSDGLGLNSAWQVPVYGNHPGEPCYAAGDFAGSKCDQAWRWMLDYVQDVSGNTMTYRYSREYNRYGHNNNTGTSQYTAGGRLWYMEYGTSAGTEGTTDAPVRVTPGYAERCIPTADFDCAESKLNAANSSHWPDVPQDLICTSTTSCPSATAPAFFDRKRLTGITASIRDAGVLVPVDSWALTQSFQDPGDGSDPALWLGSIKHTGQGGSASDIALPEVTFHGAQKDNRVDTTGDLGPAMTRYRIDQIRSESGGLTSIAYSERECSTSNLPASPQSNTMRCQPVWWTPVGAAQQVMEYFHHFRVTSVTQDARVSGTVPVDTTYEYTGGPAWHYSDNELIKPKHRTWSQLRGYSRVDVFTGAEQEGEPRLRTAYRYFRGMFGDNNGSGGTRTDKVDGIEDLDQFSGMVREEITYNGSAVVGQTKSTPWRSGATVTDPVDSSKKAYHTGISKSESVTPLAGGGTRTTSTETELDPVYGMPTKVFERGDTSAPGDERCTETTYKRNTTLNILTTVQREVTVDVACGQASLPEDPADVVSDVQYAYDTLGVGVTPTRGLLTLRQEASSYSGDNPVYVDVEQFRYNAQGQRTRQYNALGKITSTAYDNTSGLTRSSTVTTPDPDGTGALTGLATTTQVDPKWGVPVKVTDPNGKITQGRYDALGRLTGVWEPGRVPDQDNPTTKFTYSVSSSGLNSVLSETLNWDASAYVKSSVIYDGLLRQRQSQAPSASASTTGRVISDTLYDSRGLTWVTRDGWSATGTPAASLLVSQTAVNSRTVTTFDGVGRPVTETFQAGEGEQPDNGTSYLDKWTTRTTYDGSNRVSIDPPTGGTPTTTVTDSRGRMTELWQYTGASPSGTHHVTSYEYDGADRLVGVSDPSGNEWSYGFDLRGRQTSASDPDKGDSSTTYDNASQVLTTTDARGKTLGYTYDGLGRKTSMRDGGTTGAVRASWAYDLLGDGSVVKGQQTASTRHHQTGSGTVQYTTRIGGFTDRYLPTSTTVSIPASDATPAGLAGDYTYEFTYTQDGRVRTQTMPGVGPIGDEGLTTFYSATNAADGLTGGYGWGDYLIRADYLPTGELSYTRSGNTYAYQESMYYDRGTRRLEGVTTTQQTGSTEDQLHELRHSAIAYDDAGNVLSVKDTPSAALGNQPKDQQCFTYDWARRLTGAWTPANGDCAAAPSVAGLGGGDPYWKSYAYDVTGNRTSSVLHRSATGGGDVTSTYTRPAAGASSVRPHGVTGVTAAAGGASVGASTYSYDAAGNMTGRIVAGKAKQALSWDIEGELNSVAKDADGDGTVESAEQAAADGYVYSADGDRLLREQDGDTTLYLPGQEVTLDGDTGAVTANRYYSFAGKTVAVRSASRFSDVASVFSDHHNTGTIQIGNTTNQVVRRYTDPFGTERDQAAGVDPALDPAGGPSGGGTGWKGDHGFLDKPQDTTGLTAVGARMYDPLLGSFISVDPIMDLADPQQWNAYGYANNNPVTFSDPTGLLFSECHDGSHQCSVNSGGNISVKRNWDRCERGATSCVRNSGGDKPVKVRECYTAYACGYYATHADGYETSSGTPVGLTDHSSGIAKSVVRSAAAAFAHRQAQEVAAARAREAASHQREQKNGWLESAGDWAQYNFTTARGIEAWTGTGADWTGYLSLGALALQGIATFLAAATSWTGIGGVTFAALAAGFGTGAAVLGWMSTGLSFANGFANSRLGRHGEAGRSYASGGVGLVTGGIGSGAARLSLKMGMENSPYVSDFMIGVGGWLGGEVVGKDG